MHDEYKNENDWILDVYLDQEHMRQMDAFVEEMQADFLRLRTDDGGFYDGF